MSAEGNFEKTRIQNPDDAHDVANILSSYLEGGEKPTAKDYDDALYQLEELQKVIAEEKIPESVDKALRVFVAGTSVVMDRVPRLLVAAALNVLPYPKNVKESMRSQLGGGIIDQLKGMPANYEERRDLFQTAREELEKWKMEAEEFAKRQIEQK